jgi:hypothetical protein
MIARPSIFGRFSHNLKKNCHGENCPGFEYTHEQYTRKGPKI